MIALEKAVFDVRIAFALPIASTKRNGTVDI